MEQQRAYYESAGLKNYPGYGDNGVSSKSGAYTPDSLSGRQSTESPDLKKTSSVTPDPAAQAQALQAYYSQSMGGAGGGVGQGGMGATHGQMSSLPPLLPMAAQLSQYASSTAAAASAGYSQASAGTPGSAASQAADYSRRPLSVLF